MADRRSGDRAAAEEPSDADGRSAQRLQRVSGSLGSRPGVSISAARIPVWVGDAAVRHQRRFLFCAAECGVESVGCEGTQAGASDPAPAASRLDRLFICGLLGFYIFSLSFTIYVYRQT